jgi:hypothetical protein
LHWNLWQRICWFRCNWFRWWLWKYRFVDILTSWQYELMFISFLLTMSIWSDKKC